MIQKRKVEISKIVPNDLKFSPIIEAEFKTPLNFQTIPTFFELIIEL